MSFPINPAATSGFASSTRYDAHRPSYPPASVDALLSALRLTNSPPGARVLELGAGTGKFSALLAARPERFEILSVEPHAEMRRVLEGKRLEQVTVVEGSAERLGAVEDGWAETCVVAQVRRISPEGASGTVGGELSAGTTRLFTGMVGLHFECVCFESC